MRKRPASVDVACWLLWALVLAGLVVSVLVVVYRDDLAETWSTESAGDSTVQPLDFVPVIIVCYLVIALTTVVLIPLMRHGHNWARHSLGGIALGILLAALAVVRTAPPPLFRGFLVAAAVLAAVSMVFLWHPDGRAYFRGDDDEHDRTTTAAD